MKASVHASVRPAAVFVSALLMGIGYPLSKLFFEDGIAVLPFCLSYVGARILVQLPFVARGSWRFSRSQFLWLAMFGLVGGLLRVCETAGIANGLPVSLVTFLVFSHPLWLALIATLCFREKYDASAMLRISLATSGIALLTGISASELDGKWLLTLAPLAAGVLVALWILFSKAIQQRGVPMVFVSFFYDLFSFAVLLTATVFVPSPPGSWELWYRWISTPPHLLATIAFGALVGVLPNYFFYWGGRGLPSCIPAAMLLFQPVVAAGLAWFLWGEALSRYFVVGAGCILFANLPSGFFAPAFRRVSTVLFGGFTGRPAAKVLYWPRRVISVSRARGEQRPAA